MWKSLFFPLDRFFRIVILISQSESVTLSVDYLISSAQAGRATCLGFFLASVRNDILAIRSSTMKGYFKSTIFFDATNPPTSILYK